MKDAFTDWELLSRLTAADVLRELPDYPRHKAQHLARIMHWCARKHVDVVPMARTGDWRLVYLFRGNDDERNAAAVALANDPDFIFATPGDRRARRLLRQGWAKGKDARVRDVLVPAAILEAAHELTDGAVRRDRIGREHVLDGRGKRTTFRPLDLDDDQLLALLKQRAQAIFEALILEDLPAATTDTPTTSVKKRHARAQQLIQALSGNGSVTLTVRERQIVAWTLDGKSLSQIAELLGKSVGWVRYRKKRLELKLYNTTWRG